MYYCDVLKKHILFQQLYRCRMFVCLFLIVYGVSSGSRLSSLGPRVSPNLAYLGLWVSSAQKQIFLFELEVRIYRDHYVRIPYILLTVVCHFMQMVAIQEDISFFRIIGNTTTK